MADLECASYVPPWLGTARRRHVYEAEVLIGGSDEEEGPGHEEVSHLWEHEALLSRCWRLPHPLSALS